MAELAERGVIEAYNLPLGVMTLLHRELAGGRPGLITEIGLGTFVDPRVEGGRMNDRTTEDIVEVVTLGGESSPWGERSTSGTSPTGSTSPTSAAAAPILTGT